MTLAQGRLNGQSRQTSTVPRHVQGTHCAGQVPYSTSLASFKGRGGPLKATSLGQGLALGRGIVFSRLTGVKGSEPLDVGSVHADSC